ncbi:hypothetical protein CCH79_00017325 [Gambusia affinis]|uniref:Cardiolipin synthase (CMP-forming) n=1 Tax=Gambusia affinis TaxID=33528 RepID=A0A315VJH6_GAMAF|nr:hypothetical protein CCH79_00017325 [Gambusia affinis]
MDCRGSRSSVQRVKSFGLAEGSVLVHRRRLVRSADVLRPLFLPRVRGLCSRKTEEASDKSTATDRDTVPGQGLFKFKELVSPNGTEAAIAVNPPTGQRAAASHTDSKEKNCRPEAECSDLLSMTFQKELRTAERISSIEFFRPQYENPWTVPNLLCVCRILLAPYLGYLITQQHFDLSLGLFTLAGATDLNPEASLPVPSMSLCLLQLDGFIARTWPTQKSALGSALDPLADKILISVLYVSLTYAELIPAPLTALVIFRDIGLIAAVFWVRYKTVPPPVTLSKFFNPCYTTAQLKPTLFSKVNTAIQLFLVAASLAAPVFHYTDSTLLQCLWYVTAVTTAASGYSYWHYGRKTVKIPVTPPPSRDAPLPLAPLPGYGPLSSS